MKKLVSIAVSAALLTSVSFSANAEQENASSDSKTMSRIKSATASDFSYTYASLDYISAANTNGFSLNGSVAILENKSWGGLSIIGTYSNLTNDKSFYDVDIRTLSLGALYHLNAG